MKSILFQLGFLSLLLSLTSCGNKPLGLVGINDQVYNYSYTLPRKVKTLRIDHFSEEPRLIQLDRPMTEISFSAIRGKDYIELYFKDQPNLTGGLKINAPSKNQVSDESFGSNKMNLSHLKHPLMTFSFYYKGEGKAKSIRIFAL